ncbi:MAG: helix-turn-helix domain-containing protein [Ignavibacteriae bacterium]|nr:helix-turn-helix domain-containing protein [Ignavibacteria bacterium]MBI3363732.1 helix-turn-helix domain-containing protein [Ignavibacteriota bacterium]
MKSLDTIDFGQAVKEQRKQLSLPLSRLSSRLKVTKGYLSRLESGKAVPSLTMVKKLSKILKLDSTKLGILAGYLPSDVEKILYANPVTAPAFLRETFGDYYIQGHTMKQNCQEESVSIAHKTRYELEQSDCFRWLDERKSNSIHAIVTDPPYGLKEYTATEKAKLRNGNGGVWRIPPKLDGYERQPLPRFTVLNQEEKNELKRFFLDWAQKAYKVLVPGGHIFIATNPLLSHIVYEAIEKAGFEKRGEIIRLVQTLRGGDRPKNAHKEFSDVTVMPRSCWEPWGLFRKPCEGRVQDNLRKWKTGGLRRVSNDQPFCDVIKSSPTRTSEREIAPHPSLKPQAFMRQIVRAALPLGQGVILDPFMGAGSTIAAACAIGYRSIGVESDPEFYRVAVKAIPQLAVLKTTNGNSVSIPELPIESQEELFVLR